MHRLCSYCLGNSICSHELGIKSITRFIGRTIANIYSRWILDPVSRESDGNTSLYPCTFSDSTSSASDDYTTFVKSYARLLDEALDTHAFISTNGDNADKLTSTIEVMPQVQSLIDHAIGCWAVGAASRSFLVRSAMKHVICDSISWYAAEMDKVLENLI
ncbi:hypothetical protein SASPL_149560 [Salvia splendens]|uniref:AP180 N-terminal homology (ANTH) domain-containing protein n=1 Tax=Salvia splendens TaxID=180675 RepID=A0A8X8WB20_SALSN|nr:hypothetical protein SASPL_149560 [Salvia splendens]